MGAKPAPLRIPREGDPDFGEPGTICFLCLLLIESVEDRLEWHGVGNCVAFCECCGLDWGNAKPDCRHCKGKGYVPFKATSRP